MLQVFHRATSRRFGYMLLDLHPASSDDVRLYSYILKDEGWTRYYRTLKMERTDPIIVKEIVKEYPFENALESIFSDHVNHMHPYDTDYNHLQNTLNLIKTR